MKVYCHANVMSYSVLGRSRSSIRTIMPYQCNVPLSDDGSVVSIAAASGVCREEKLDVAHGVTNLPLLLL